MLKVFCSLLLFAFAGLSAAQSGTLSVAGVMAAPFASELVAAPTGARVAWVEYREGRRNVWVASGPAWQGTPVTHFNDDDGQEISQLGWSPTGDSVLFVRGGDSENGGENPNPAALPTKPSRDIWGVALTSVTPIAIKIAEGHTPAFSPKGDVIAFVRGSEILTVKPTGNDAAVIVHERAVVDSLVWSPKGDALAFVSHRHEHSFVGVYTPASKSLRYLDASVDEDMFPAWSPDGASLAYVRIPAGVNEQNGAHRADVPWSIRIASLESGKGHQIFQAAPGNGSVFHPIVSDRQLFWLANGKLVFPWEKTGWCHLYSVSTAGGEPAELTPGAGEVESVSLHAPDTIFYSSNIGDIDARHVWQTGAQPQQLTTQEGIQTSPVSSADGSALAFISASYNTAAHVAIHLKSGETRNLNAAIHPLPQLVKPQNILLTAADGLTIHAQLFLPPNDGKKHPALVFFHGGSRRQMLPAFHYMFYYSNAYAMNQYLAGQGFAVLSVNYRSGIGYGMEFREALNYGVQGASEYYDVMGAGLYLRSRSDVDPKRIGAWGGSYGGYLTALALARSSDLFAAGVDFHGVHNWASLRGLDQEPGRIAFESSPMASVKDWRSPVLLIHGDDDRNVDFAQTEELVKALRTQKVEFEQLIFPNEIHDFLLHRSWIQAYEASADFLKRKLQ